MDKPTRPFLVLARNPRKTIKYNGEDITGDPIVYAKHGYEDMWEMGLGFIAEDKDKSGLWGLVSPAHLIETWRAMRVFERLDEVDKNYSLATSYESAKTNTEMPSNGTLERMINMCAVNKVFVHVSELVDEGMKYGVRYSPLINQRIKEYSEALKVYRLKETMINKLMYITSADRKYKVIHNYPVDDEASRTNAAFWRCIETVDGYFDRRERVQELEGQGYTVKARGKELYAVVGYAEYEFACNNIAKLHRC